MTISEKQIYPRANDRETVYLKHVITNPNIIVGDFTMYNDFVRDRSDFQSSGTGRMRDRRMRTGDSDIKLRKTGTGSPGSADFCSELRQHGKIFVTC